MSVAKSQINSYTSESLYKRGIFLIFRDMVNDIRSSKELIWQLFLRDFKGKYKQSLLGWLWVILSPLIAVGTFFVLNKSGVVRVGNIEAPYVLYGLIGITFWQVFSGGLTSVTASITSAGSLVQKIRFPNEVLVIASLGQALPSFMIRTFMVLLLFLFFGRLPSILFLLSPLFLVPIFLLTLGIGFITSLFNVVVRDVASLVGSVMGLILFLTPIMYALPKSGLLGKVNTYNPLFFLVAVPRDLIIYGKTEFLTQFLWSSVVSLVIFILGWFVFHISQPKLVERL